MTQSNGHDPHSAVVLEEDRTVAKEAPTSAPVPPGATQVFATRSKFGTPQFGQNKVVLIAGGAIVVALLLFVFSSAPTHRGGRKGAERVAHPVAASQDDKISDEEKSLFPVLESTKPRAITSNAGTLGEKDVERTATRQPRQPSFTEPKVPQDGTLASIPPFDSDSTWQAPPYQAAHAVPQSSVESAKMTREESSLVFVQKISQTTSTESTKSMVDPSESLGLPIGTRLRARLESAASTAVKTPVIAVVEYNYEKNGEIMIPAGTKVFGRIEQADRSGYVSIRFDRMLMPDGASINIDAVATNLSIGPLRGKVEGKNSGKNALVRSLSGIGEMGALLAGRNGSISQPFSEGDLIREHISTNICESADQEITRLSLTEHVVVSVSANTPIYVIFDRSANQIPAPERRPDAASVGSSNSADSLRQLLQLQRELNQNNEGASH